VVTEQLAERRLHPARRLSQGSRRPACLHACLDRAGETGGVWVSRRRWKADAAAMEIAGSQYAVLLHDRQLRRTLTASQSPAGARVSLRRAGIAVGNLVRAIQSRGARLDWSHERRIAARQDRAARLSNG
jgi:hypothetical protein